MKGYVFDKGYHPGGKGEFDITQVEKANLFDKGYLIHLNFTVHLNFFIECFLNLKG